MSEMSEKLRQAPGYWRWSSSVLALAAASAILGCGGRLIEIKSLLDDPGRYDGKIVQVSGEVTENVGVLTYGAYRVDDGTGAITVISKQGGAPRQGAEIRVKGQFRSGFTFGATSLAVIEEENRKALED